MSIASSGRDTGSAGRRLASNTGWRLGAFGARTVGGLTVTILVARTEGPLGLGRFQLALAVTLLLSFLVTLGLQKQLVRELARRPDRARERVDAALLLALVAGFLVSLAVLGVGAGFGLDVELVMIAMLALIADSATRIVMALFWALERMRYETISVGIQEAAFVALTVPALASGLGARGALLAYLASRVVGFVVAWVIAAARLGCPTRPRWVPGVMASTLRSTIPFAVDDGLSLAYIRVDAVMLGAFRGQTAVGLYQAATNLVLYLNILPRMLNMSMYPQMSRAWPGRPDELRRLRDFSLRLLSLVSLPIAVGSFLLAPRILELIYGQGFGRAVVVYQLLAPIIPIRMLGNTLGTALTSVDRQGWRTVAVGVAAAANVALNLLLIPMWSIVGAAVATLVTETGLFVAYAVLLRRVVGRSSLVPAVAIPGLACLPMALVLLALSSAPLISAIAAAAIVYAVAIAGIALWLMPRPVLAPKAVVSSLLRWTS